MNREFKFRAWDNISGSMTYLDEKDSNDFFIGYTDQKLVLYVNEPADIESGGEHEQVDRWYINEDCVIMQYTGLKDMNGKDIFEWDVISYTNMGIIITTPVAQSSYGWYPFTDKSYELETATNIEVLGNVYENDELTAFREEEVLTSSNKLKSDIEFHSQNLQNAHSYISENLGIPNSCNGDITATSVSTLNRDRAIFEAGISVGRDGTTCSTDQEFKDMLDSLPPSDAHLNDI